MDEFVLFQQATTFVFLLQLAKEKDAPDSILFQQLRTIHRLRSIIEESVTMEEKERLVTYYVVIEKWSKEKGWSAAFVTAHSIYREAFRFDIFLPNDRKLIDGVIENKFLFLFLCFFPHRKGRNIHKLMQALLHHFKWQEYKIDGVE